MAFSATMFLMQPILRLQSGAAAGRAFNPAQPDTQGINVKNSLSRQQYGGTLGFPVKRDKSFLFVAFEGLRQDAQNAVPILTNTRIFSPSD